MAFRQFMEPFSQILLDSAILGAFGDEHTAVLPSALATSIGPSTHFC